jgi:hypothetical protein
MLVLATIDTIDTVAAVAGKAESSARVISAEAATYADAVEALSTMVPEGWLILSYRVPDR